MFVALDDNRPSRRRVKKWKVPLELFDRTYDASGSVLSPVGFYKH